jgi:hypothetical protein
MPSRTGCALDTANYSCCIATARSLHGRAAKPDDFAVLSTRSHRFVGWFRVWRRATVTVAKVLDHLRHRPEDVVQAFLVGPASFGVELRKREPTEHDFLVVFGDRHALQKRMSVLDIGSPANIL